MTDERLDASNCVKMVQEVLGMDVNGAHFGRVVEARRLAKEADRNIVS